MRAHPRPWIEVLAEMPDFWSKRGKRHALAAILALALVLIGIELEN